MSKGLLMAVVALGAGHAKAAVFVLAMVAGMGLFEVVERMRGGAADTREGEGA
jgi:hypothetical protein